MSMIEKYRNAKMLPVEIYMPKRLDHMNVSKAKEILYKINDKREPRTRTRKKNLQTRVERLQYVLKIKSDKKHDVDLSKIERAKSFHILSQRKAYVTEIMYARSTGMSYTSKVNL